MPRREHPDAAFVADLVERFGVFAPVTPRRMFGGHGLFVEGAMFALVYDGAVYLKTDEVNRPDYVALGLQPWVLESAPRTSPTSYYAPPDEAMDDMDALRPWFEAALAAARRAAAKRKPRSRKPST